MTRDEAIARLRSMGRNASARDWALGETIVVTIREPSKDFSQVYSGAVYLYPDKDGTWKLIDFGRLNTEEGYDDLESAIHGAHEYIGRRERDLRVQRE